MFISAMIRTTRNINHINRCLLLKSTSTCATDYSEVDTCKKSRWHDFTSGVYATTTFTWLSISKVQLHGNDLGGFQIQWFSVLSEIEARPDDASLTAMFLTRLRNKSFINADLIYFSNLRPSHTVKCYEWLVAVVQKNVLQHEEEQLVREYTRQAGQPYL